MKRISLIIAVAIIVALLCSCGLSNSNDNKAMNDKSDLLIGTWFGEVEGRTSTYTFKSNGVGVAINDAGTEIPFTYQVIDDTSLDFEYTINGEKISETSTFILNGDTLTLDEVEFVRQ